VIGYGNQLAGRIAADDGVLATQSLARGRRFLGGGLELVRGHVGGIKAGSLGFGADVLDKRRVLGQPVPGPIVDPDISLDCRIGDALE
jgi:hypothetical protein